MTEKEDDGDPNRSSIDLAEDRTNWAEDRTLMANERTFAGWMRTGLAAVGIGIAFNALFGKLEPAWLARVLATMFICVGIGIFYLAQRNSCRVCTRMNSHAAQPVDGRYMRLVALAFGIASAGLIVGIWIM